MRKRRYIDEAGDDYARMHAQEQAYPQGHVQVHAQAQPHPHSSSQQHVHPRASLDLDEGFVDPIGSARSYRNVQANGEVYRAQAGGQARAPHAQAGGGQARRTTSDDARAYRAQAPSYRGAAQMRDASYAPSRGGAPSSAQAEYENYRARQMQMHSRDSGKYHARPSSLDASSEKVSRSPALTIGLAVVCVVLLLVVVVRVPAFLGTLSKATETGAALSAQQSQLGELQTTNQQLQQSVDSMQATIDTYNAKK